jgi:hypothetical protein
MGRHSTGAWTVYESLRIELSYLLKHKYIEKDCIKYCTLSWTDAHGNNSGSISLICSYLDFISGKYIELDYTITSRDGEKTNHNYKIELIEQDSNLGKGKVLYFLCPQTGQKCRILYKAYGSPIFKSRNAYRYRLYYDCQQSSKLSKYNDTYWRVEKHLEKIKKEACRGRRKYKGILTKKTQRYKRLIKKQMVMDDLRWTAGMPKSIWKSMQDERLNY